MKTIDLHFIDIIHNSIRAKATKIIVNIEDNSKKNIFKFDIIDNGCGIGKDALEQIQSNFLSSRKERKIGMGLALLRYYAELTGGSFSISSEINVGTSISATFMKNSIDMQPLGDIADVIASFICQFQNIEFVFSYNLNDELFELCSSDIKNIFEDIDLNNAEIIKNIKELIAENIKEQ